MENGTQNTTQTTQHFKTTYERKLHDYIEHRAVVEEAKADLARDGAELVALHHELCIAFNERTGREFIYGADEFNYLDERLADDRLAFKAAALKKEKVHGNTDAVADVGSH